MTYGKVHTDGSRSGGQPVEPKLLTEAEAMRLATYADVETILTELRERGLIAPEPPVDPLLLEAREVCASVEPNIASNARKGDWDHSFSMKLALAALKRGMELARPELTREQVREAYYDAGGLEVGSFIDRLHAALTEQVRP